MSSELTTTDSAGAIDVATLNYSSVVTRIPLPVRALFDVEVDGLLGFSLIPKNDLARDLAGAWTGGEIRRVCHSRGFLGDPHLDMHKRRMNVTRLECIIEPRPLLTTGGDPFFTGQSISKEEHDVALAAIEAHRAAQRPKPRATPKRKRAK